MKWLFDGKHAFQKRVAWLAGMLTSIAQAVATLAAVLNSTPN